jgi:hypothetical protein
VFGNLPDPRREPLEILGRVLEALRHGIDALEVLDEQKSEIPTYPKGSFKVGGADGKLH